MREADTLQCKELRDKNLCCFSLRSLRSFAAIQLLLQVAALGLFAPFCAFLRKINPSY
jgi:hypothetical protein